ncbi:MAG: hypothetical protein HC824_06515 [Synechococcales cyanobacterium RM1_1_8]|nr:hypothetical protein [Synechococcales cyanobacterium RM1_1_8]
MFLIWAGGGGTKGLHRHLDPPTQSLSPSRPNPSHARLAPAAPPLRRSLTTRPAATAQGKIAPIAAPSSIRPDPTHRCRLTAQ